MCVMKDKEVAQPLVIQLTASTTPNNSIGNNYSDVVLNC